MIEHLPKESLKYEPAFMVAMQKALIDANPVLRQSAAYTMGMAGKVGGEGYAKQAIASLQQLIQIVQHPEARADENVFATENALAAIGKICRAHGALFDASQVLSLWFNALPIVEDDQEFGDTYNYLIDLIEGNHSSVTLNNPQNLGKAVDVLTQVLVNPGTKEQEALVQRILTTLRTVLSQCDETTRTGLWNTLPQDRLKMLAAKGYF